MIVSLGLLLMSLFVLVWWDILQSKVPVVLSLSLDSLEFYNKRKEKLAG